MKKILESSFRFNKIKYIEVDPYGEEDWDEYELKSNDKFYFWGLSKGIPVVGIGISNLKNNQFHLNIINCSDKDIISKTIILHEQTRQNINQNQYSNYMNYSDFNFNLSTLVTESKFSKYYKNIHESVRINIYDSVKKLTKEIITIGNSIDTNEENIIQLKTSMKSKEEFPSVNHIELDDNEYIYIKLFVENKIYKTDILLVELSDKSDENGGYSLIDKENNQKVLYLLKTYDKLKEKKHLLIKSKSEDNTQKYITNDKEIYNEFVIKITNMINKNIENEINLKRKKYEEYQILLDQKKEIVQKLRNEYINFNFSKTVEELKKMVEK